MRQDNGAAYSKRLFEIHFNAARAAIPELAGVTFHGLRATRVIELRQGGATTLQIQDQVGMSLPRL
jgi:integrase